MIESYAFFNFYIPELRKWVTPILKSGLVDEVRVCIAPMIAGGSNAITLVGGEGFDYMADSKKLKFKNSFQLDNDLILCYDVLND